MSTPQAESLLERDGERHAIDALLDAGRGGQGAVLLVEGPPGVGKTALMGLTAARAAERGMRVLHARGLPLEQTFAFGVARQLFEPPLRAAPAVERRRLLKGAAALAAPVLGTSAVPDEPVVDAHAARHALVWLAANLAAERPLCLLVDDAHWGDSPSLAWLLSLANRAGELPLVLGLAVRRGDPGAGAPTLLELAALPGVHTVEPRPLGAAGVATLVRASLGEDAADAVCAACHVATGGNPFLVSELTLALAERPPDSDRPDAIADFGAARVAAAVERRLARAPRGTLELARAVAALGGDAQLLDAAKLAGLAAGDAERAADALADATVLDRGLPLRFVHPTVRAAVENAIPPGTRARLRGEAIAMLRAQDAPTERIAAHVLAVPAANDPAAVDALATAAQAAAGRGAPEMAAVYLRRALAEPPVAERRADVLHALGLAEMANREPDATDHLLAAVQLANPGDRAMMALQAARVLGIAGRAIDAVELCQTGLASDPGGTAAGLLEAELIANAGAAAQLTPLARRQLRADGPRPLPPHHEAAEAWVRLADPDENAVDRLANMARSSLAALADGDPTLALTAALIVLVWTDHGSDARPTLDGLVSRARSLGSPNGVAHFVCFRGILAAREGRLAEAEADLAESVAFNLAEPTPEGMSWPLAYLLTVAAGRGGDEPVLDADRVLGDELGDWFGSALLVEHRAAFALQHGRYADALRQLDDAARRWQELGVTGPPFASWRVERSIALTHTGERQDAQRLAREHADLARRAGSVRELARAQHAFALADPSPDAEQLLRETAALLEETVAPLEQARVLSDLGDLLRREGRRTDAREPLRHALDLAHRCGAIRLAGEIDARLRAAGGRPRRPYVSGAEALTPAERRVAVRAATGRSNREIAQALFISLNTVETHLRHVYRKLEITNRADIAAQIEE